jgi:hypothetical protein
VIYLLQMSCGDYYCDGQHPAGAYSTRERAEAAFEDALKVQPDWALKYPDCDSRAYEGGSIEEIEVDAPPVER